MSDEEREELEQSQGIHSGGDDPDGALPQDQPSSPYDGEPSQSVTSCISAKSSKLFKPLAEKIMATMALQAASAALPDIPWGEIVVLHIFRVIITQLDRDIEGLATEEMPNIADQIDVHPLHAAASTGQVDASLCSRLVSNKNTIPVGDKKVEALENAWSFTCGFDCDELDSYGKSALHWASSAGLEDWVSALLQSGADPNIADRRGLTALHEAVAGSHDATARLLVKGGADVGYQECMRGRSPLHLAAMFGTPELVKMLCDAGARHDLRDRWDGFTPLMSAVAKGKLEATEVLLERGAAPETESVMVLTPLMVAAIMGYVDVAKALIRGGANPRHAGIGNLTPLHLASEKGHADLVEHLLRAGADPKARVANPPPRSTPLHVACRSTRLASVVALLRGGADETMRDETPAPSSPADPTVSCSACPPSTTPFDVVGFGRFSPHQDPRERDSSETALEYQLRRDPETIERIREALQRAPADRAWRRRSWIVMFWSASSRRRDGDCHAAKDTRAEKHAAPGEEGGACRDGEVRANSPTGGLKRARREDDAEEVVDLNFEGEAAKVKTGDDDVVCTLGAVAGAAADDEVVTGTGRVSAEGEEFCGDGGSSGGGDGCDDGAESFQGLCGRLFDLADVEEGAFRRIVSFL